MSLFAENREGLTPRGLAEKRDRQKFHRVIKTLKKYEQMELDRKEPEV